MNSDDLPHHCNVPPAALDALHKALPSSVFADDAKALTEASLDASRFAVQPELVLRPTGEDQVGIILGIANQHRVAITTRGAGSATTGAATPLHGGWVLDLRGLNSIRIDATQGFAHVGAGAVTADINAAAAKHGWFYPPDPSSVRHSTIGGNIATNAGGLRAARYGVTRDYVMQLSGYLADGKPFNFGAPLRKFAAGYNLRDLLIGSEGTLAVVTAAVLRLIPAPAQRQTWLAAFANESAALAAVRRILEARVIPSVCEFIDRQTVTCHKLHYGANLFPALKLNETGPTARYLTADERQSPAVLLIEIDGDSSSIERNGKLLRACLEPDSLEIRATDDDAEAETLWNIRRTCSQAMFRMATTKLNEDIVVPLAAYDQLIEFTLELRAETGLATPTFGHAADGNFHVHIMYDREDPAQCEVAAEGIERVMRRVVELGGAITGEHGIGLAKSPFLALQHPPHQIELMQSVKHAFDPQSILNPGKIFTPFRLWEHPRTDVAFPWDHK